MKIENNFFKERVPLLNKAMDTYSLRMETAAKNIANINSVDYKPERVAFEELFSQQLAISGSKTDNKHISIGAEPNPNPEILARSTPSGEEYNSGENDINLDREMADIAETQIRFQFASQGISKYFRQLGGAITGTSNF